MGAKKTLIKVRLGTFFNKRGDKYMSNYSNILLFMIMSFMCSYGRLRGIREMIKKIGYHKKLYPKKYIVPDKKIANLFKINERSIPKWLYYELIMVIVYALFFPVNTILFLVTNGEIDLFVLQASILMIDELCFWIVSDE